MRPGPRRPQQVPSGEEGSQRKHDECPQRRERELHRGTNIVRLTQFLLIQEVRVNTRGLLDVTTWRTSRQNLTCGCGAAQIDCHHLCCSLLFHVILQSSYQNARLPSSILLSLFMRILLICEFRISRRATKTIVLHTVLSTPAVGVLLHFGEVLWVLIRFFSALTVPLVICKYSRLAGVARRRPGHTGLSPLGIPSPLISAFHPPTPPDPNLSKKYMKCFYTIQILAVIMAEMLLDTMPILQLFHALTAMTFPQ